MDHEPKQVISDSEHNICSFLLKSETVEDDVMYIIQLKSKKGGARGGGEPKWRKADREDK